MGRREAVDVEGAELLEQVAEDFGKEAEVHAVDHFAQGVSADDHLPPHPAKDDLETARLADAEDDQLRSRAESSRWISRPSPLMPSGT